MPIQIPSYVDITVLARIQDRTSQLHVHFSTGFEEDTVATDPAPEEAFKIEIRSVIGRVSEFKYLCDLRSIVRVQRNPSEAIPNSSCRKSGDELRCIRRSMVFGWQSYSKLKIVAMHLNNI